MSRGCAAAQSQPCRVKSRPRSRTRIAASRPIGFAAFPRGSFRRRDPPTTEAGIVAASPCRGEPEGPRLAWRHPGRANMSIGCAPGISCRTAMPRSFATAGPLLIVDGGFGYGQVIGCEAMDLAAERARQHGHVLRRHSQCRPSRPHRGLGRAACPPGARLGSFRQHVGLRHPGRPAWRQRPAAVGKPDRRGRACRRQAAADSRHRDLACRRREDPGRPQPGQGAGAGPRHRRRRQTDDGSGGILRRARPAPSSPSAATRARASRSSARSWPARSPAEGRAIPTIRQLGGSSTT